MNKLKKYLKSREESILFILKKPRRLYTAGTFHKLRVELKKLNALNDIIKYCSPEFKRKKIFNPFKQIFRQAGKVRDIQIEEAMLKKYFNTNLLKEYRSGLRQLRLKEQDAYFAIINKKVLRNLNKSRRAIQSFIGDVNKKKAHNYLDNKSVEIARLLNQNHLVKAQAHELRKRLKIVYYNQKLISFKKNDNMQQLESLTDLLGKWNDGQVTIRNLKKAINDSSINTHEVNQLKEIKTLLVSDNEKLFSQIKQTVIGS